MRKQRGGRWRAAGWWVAALAMVMGRAAFGDVEGLRKGFATPPDDARIMVRWWWFGPAVTKEGIERELKAMKAGGIGGVEVQPTYPLAVDSAEVKNLRFMSPEFLEMLGFTAAKCKELGMRMDLTLGSGWPYGGSIFSANEGAGRMATQVVAVNAGQTAVAAPAGAFAAFAGPAGIGGNGRGRGNAGVGDLSALKAIQILNGQAQLPAGFGGGEVLFFTTGRTGMQVKRPALGAEGPVMDHLSTAVVDKFIEQIAEPEIKACGANPPYAVFCDSLEVNGENWTGAGVDDFQRLRGYDLRPYLPALLGNFGDRADDVRYDWARTVTDMFNENFSGRLEALAKKYHSRFRIQDYGSPPAGLYSYAYADLPEGEGGGNGNWRGFRTTRYASSASHLMNLPVTSSETFTWIHGAPFRATPLDIKGEADTHFLDGVNQIICHGWPYTGNGAKYPGWSFYAAGVFDDQNPWTIAMPEISGYLQRVSYVMRQGTPANDVALYVDNSDVWAAAGMNYSSLNGAVTSLVGVSRELLDHGFNFDGFDDGMLAMKGKAESGALVFGDVRYKTVVLANVQRMPLETARKLDEFAKGGGLVVAVGGVPGKVPGMKATAEDQAELKGIMDRIFQGEKHKGEVVREENQLGASLAKEVNPDVAMGPVAAEIGAVHRHLEDGDVYFLANTGNTAHHNVSVSFHVGGMTGAELWDPLTGQMSPLQVLFIMPLSQTATATLDFEPYESHIVVFGKGAATHMLYSQITAQADLSKGWSVKFTGIDQPVAMDQLRSWTDEPRTRNYSGVASYERTFTLSAEAAKSATYLDFGTGRATAGGGGRGVQGYQAMLDAPVREAAVVYVNGERAGAVWCPPYRLDVTRFLKAGENAIRIEVANTAVNRLAAEGFPNYDYNGLPANWRSRFQPQGVQLLSQPLPSGLMGPVVLETVLSGR